jgi:hypothetical protein
MSDPSGLRFREARPGDAHAIARLHADSWQRHYRGAYSDEFLDSDVAGYLLPAWVERVSMPHQDTRTILWPAAGRTSAQLSATTTIGRLTGLSNRDPSWHRDAEPVADPHTRQGLLPGTLQRPIEPAELDE